MQDLLRKSGLSPDRLELELPESVFLQNLQESLHSLERFKALGVKLTIDDFGTGYSSLNLLKKIEVDRLKIDRSFIAKLHQSKEDEALVKAIVCLGKSLGFEIGAVGVEREEQWGLLAYHGCQEMQGFLIQPPLDLKACTQLLQKLHQKEQPLHLPTRD